MRYWRKRHEGLDLEAELRANRPEPSSEFVHRLEARVRNDGRRSRAGSLRVAFVGAVTAVMLLALASVGGVGYASSAAQDAAVSVKRVVTPKDVIQIVKRGSEFAVLAKPFGAADLSKAMTALLDETEAKREPSAARRG